MKKVTGVVAQTAAEKAKERVFNAAANSDSIVIKEFVRNGGDVNMTFKGEPILGIAAKRGRVNVVKLLLKNGADPSHRDDDGARALRHVLQGGNYEVAIILMDKIIREDVNYSFILSEELKRVDSGSFIEGVIRSKNPLGAMIFDKLGDDIDKFNKGRDFGNYAISNCFFNCVGWKDFREYPYELRSARGILERFAESGAVVDFDLPRYGDSKEGDQEFEETVLQVAKHCYNSFMNIQLLSIYEGPSAKSSIALGCSMNVVALLYDHKDKIIGVNKKVTDNLSLISDLESAEKLFEEISQDMGLHFNISDKQLKSGLGCVIQSDFCDVMNVLEAAGLSSSDVLARKMIENALEIEGVDVVSDRTSTVASGLGAQVDLAGSAPPGVASGEGPGVRVSRAGEGRVIRYLESMVDARIERLESMVRAGSRQGGSDESNPSSDDESVSSVDTDDLSDEEERMVQERARLEADIAAIMSSLGSPNPAPQEPQGVVVDGNDGRGNVDDGRS